MEPTGAGPIPASPRPTWRTRLPFFYGWVVVASVFLAEALIYSPQYSFSVFFVALLEDFGWARAPTASVFSLFVIVISVGGAPAGVITDRFGPSRVVPAGGILLALGLAATSQVTELWQFYVTYGLICGTGIALAGWVPFVAVLSRWFSAKRGVAMGIASAGVGMGIVAMVPLSQYLISSFGWRSAYLILAALVLLGVVPQAAYLQMGWPEELGLKADGATDRDGSGDRRRPEPPRKLVVVDRNWVSQNWSLAASMRTTRFWALGGMMTLGVVTTQMLWVHQVAYLVDGGFDRMFAASVVGLAGFVSMPAKILWGVLSDRLGRELTYTLGICSLLSGILLLALTRALPAVWLVLLFAFMFAVGYAVSAPIGPTASADIFAGRSFGAIYGMLHVGNGFGSAAGAWLAGFIFDATGSYMAAFATAAACSCIGAASLWLASPGKVRRVSRAGA